MARMASHSTQLPFRTRLHVVDRSKIGYLTGWNRIHTGRYQSRRAAVRVRSARFLRIDEEQIGFDPTIVKTEGSWYIEIEPNN